MMKYKKLLVLLDISSKRNFCAKQEVFWNRMDMKSGFLI